MKAAAALREKGLPTKVCPKCKRDLPRSAFGVHRERKSGLQSWCRECKRLGTKEWRDRDPAKSLAHRQAWRAGRKRRDRADHRVWYLANRQARLEAARRWRAENPEKARAIARANNRRRRLGRSASP